MKGKQVAQLAQRRTTVLAAMLLITVFAASAQDQYDLHVFFDNSLTEGRYYYSAGEQRSGSTVLTMNGCCPVDSLQWRSPPNALKLQWRSMPGGSWRMKIHMARWRNRETHIQGRLLSFWMLSEVDLRGTELPAVRVMDGDSVESSPVALQKYCDGLPAETWRRIDVPVGVFTAGSKTISRDTIVQIAFEQDASDGIAHSVVVDDICFCDPIARQLNVLPPAGVSAQGYERHVDLRWSDVQNHDVFRYVVERASDGNGFVPIGIQRPGVRLYTDFTGEPGQTFRYRIVAEGIDGSRSFPSGVVQATTAVMNDGQLLTMVQEATFRYFWDNGHPVSGLARENTPGEPDLITAGASGFGIMTIPVAIERGFITREQGLERMQTIVRFLRTADRFHGAWGHFMDGNTGRVIPLFGNEDNGGDLVETAFLVQGLLAVRSYFDGTSPEEKRLREEITFLWEGVEWDWYRKDPAGEVLYWHWSPDQGWVIGHPLIGFNETMIVYLLAIASPTHSVPASLYYSGWAGQSKQAYAYRSGWSGTEEGAFYANGHSYYGTALDVGCGSGGPLFFTHYSFLGFDPRGKRDKFTDYFVNNRHIALINRAYCLDNPGRFLGYGPSCWGLTASDNPNGYGAQSADVRFDNGTVTPTGAVASMPYTPEESMQALRHFYRDLGKELWGIYGFRDAFCPTARWVANIWMALDEGPIVVMIENFRSGLLWNLFMKNTEIQRALNSIGFVKDGKLDGGH